MQFDEISAQDLADCKFLAAALHLVAHIANQTNEHDEEAGDAADGDEIAGAERFGVSAGKLVGIRLH